MRGKREIDRRDFLRGAAAGAAVGASGLGAGCAVAPRQIAQAPSTPPREPDQRLRVGFVGVGGRGCSLLQTFVASGEVEVPIVCDVNQLAVNRAISIAGPSVAHTSKYEDVVSRDDVDAVVVATPDHWHAIVAVAACKAGKDVYVEKPLALCVAEGRRVVEAARTHGRIVQLGTQQLSGDHYRRVREMVREGKIGAVTMIRAWNFRQSAPGRGAPPDAEPPATLDWDRWLGPRPVVPYNPLRASGGFRHFWDYAGGILTDWGVHHFHSILDIMGYPDPSTASAAGGRYALQDITDIPDTLSVLYQFPGWTLEFSSRDANGKAPYGSEYGIELCGVEGTIFLDRKGYLLFSEKNRAEPAEVVGQPGVDNFLPAGLDDTHVRNFVECVRTRRLPASEVEGGHRATTLAHLGNIAYRVGRQLRWNPATERIEGDREADALLSRSYRRPYTLPEA